MVWILLAPNFSTIPGGILFNPKHINKNINKIKTPKQQLFRAAPWLFEAALSLSLTQRPAPFTASKCRRGTRTTSWVPFRYKNVGVRYIENRRWIKSPPNLGWSLMFWLFSQFPLTSQRLAIFRQGLRFYRWSLGRSNSWGNVGWLQLQKADEWYNFSRVFQLSWPSKFRCHFLFYHVFSWHLMIGLHSSHLWENMIKTGCCVVSKTLVNFLFNICK